MNSDTNAVERPQAQSCALAFVVPVFQRTQVFELIKDLEQQTFQDFLLVVVDHGKTPIEGLSLQKPWIRVIRASSDLWFTGALNRGLRFVHENISCRYIGILNDDIRLDDQRWIQSLIDVVDREQKSIVASSCFDFDNKVVYTSVVFSPLHFVFKKGQRGQSRQSVKPAVYRCDALPTRGLITRKQTLDEVGLFDEKFLPQYGSDYEWTVRAKKMGYLLLMTSFTFVRTVIKPQHEVVSGRNIYRSSPMKAFIKDFTDPFKNGSLPLTYRFSQQVFGFPYRYFYFLYHISRKFLGFLWNNYVLSRLRKETD